MKRNRIIDRRSDLLFAERVQHGIAPSLLDADRELIVDMPQSGQLVRKRHQVEQSVLGK